MLYIIVMLITAFNLALNIVMPFCEEDSAVFMFYGDKETFVLLGVSIVLLVIGMIIDTKDKNERIV